MSSVKENFATSTLIGTLFLKQGKDIRTFPPIPSKEDCKKMNSKWMYEVLISIISLFHSYCNYMGLVVIQFLKSNINFTIAELLIICKSMAANKWFG